MPVYEYRCLDCGEVFSQLLLKSADAAGPHCCSTCGSEQTRRVMSSFAVGNRVDPGPGRAAWPTSWDDTNGGDPDTLRYWRKRIEREARLEEKYPELRDPSLKTGRGETQEAAPTTSEHGHHHHHHHQHDHPHSHAEPNTPNTKGASST
jgi:putative FmdB family regulatory protein